MDRDTEDACRCEPSDWTPPTGYSGNGSVAAMAAAASGALGPDEFVGRAKINGHWYDGRHMIRVAQVTYDGSTCTVPLSALVDTLGDGETYQVRVTSMRKAEFDRMDEFAGF